MNFPVGRTKVVVNDEEQYSIWPADRSLPDGWRATGFEGERQGCLDHIDEVWTDMRPLSLRRAMAEEHTTETPAADVVEVPAADLVTRLSAGTHKVRLVLRPEPTPEALRSALDDGYVHVLFTETQGGTELGVWLDLDATSAPVDGPLHLVGTLTLDLREVRCEADVDPTTWTGTGRLYPL